MEWGKLPQSVSRVKPPQGQPPEAWFWKWKLNSTIKVTYVLNVINFVIIGLTWERRYMITGEDCSRLRVCNSTVLLRNRLKLWINLDLLSSSVLVLAQFNSCHHPIEGNGDIKKCAWRLCSEKNALLSDRYFESILHLTLNKASFCWVNKSCFHFTFNLEFQRS